MTANAPSSVCGRCLLHSAVEGWSNAPDRIDGFELITTVGEGGMAVVYFAEQIFPVRREVAVKLLKPGMDSRQVLARFNAEQQVLALLQHPNIAQVYDAGISHQGRPYFAMEFVDGPAITTYCQLHALNLSRRLHLFMEVCQALHHAHQKGIVHRDLKPSNILISLRNAIPAPKIIDFGIAKAIERNLVDHGIVTVDGQTLGTPLYMSPEQAAALPDVDIRTDIYSLGVVLYELLTGVTPFDHHRSSQTAELLRTVRDEDPVPPSQRFRPRSDFPEQDRLPIDLDWIALRALEKEPARRYATAEDLAHDVGRFLRDEPVRAQSPSASYRFSKYARRNRVPLVAGISVFLALSIGLISSLWQARAARRAQAKAERVAALLQRILQSPDPLQEGRNVKVLDLLEIARRRMPQELAKDPEMMVEMSLTIARTYASLTQYAPAESLLRDALHRMESRHEGESQRAISAMSDLGEVLRWQSKHEEALEYFTRATRLARGRSKELGETYPLLLQRFAETQVEVGTYTNAEPLLLEAAGHYTRLHGPTNQPLGSLLTSYANYKALIGDEEGAVNQYRVAISMLEQFPSGAQDLAVAWVNLGNELRGIQKIDEAEQCLLRALPLQRHLYGPTNLHSAMSFICLARLDLDRDRLESSEANTLQALRLHEAVLPPRHRSFVDSWATLAKVRSRQGRHAEAERLFEQSLSLARDSYSSNHWVVTALQVSLAPSLAAQGRLAEAESLLVQAHKLFHESFGANDSRTQEVLRAFERIYAIGTSNRE